MIVQPYPAGRDMSVTGDLMSHHDLKPTTKGEELKIDHADRTPREMLEKRLE
jgi:hypothetical protein